MARNLVQFQNKSIVDRRVLHLIKMWLDCPVEETDNRGRRTRSTEARDKRRGIPQGSPISPLLANIYMRRFVSLTMNTAASLSTLRQTSAGEPFLRPGLTTQGATGGAVELPGRLMRKSVQIPAPGRVVALRLPARPLPSPVPERRRLGRRGRRLLPERRAKTVRRSPHPRPRAARPKPETRGRCFVL
jgi:hypothetical protein